MYLVWLSDQIGLHKRDRLRLRENVSAHKGRNKNGRLRWSAFSLLSWFVVRTSHDREWGLGFAAIGIDDEKIGMRQTVWSHRGFVIPMSVDNLLAIR